MTTGNESTTGAETTISARQDLMTLINVFTVEPKNQQAVVDVLIDAAATMKQLPGFLSTNIHRNDEGTRVVNYVQWRAREDFESMLKDPRAIPHMQQAAELSVSYDPIVSTVVFVGRG